MENNTHKKPTLTHASLFSGIGGFDLAAEWMGWENIFHCENNAFCQKVLNYHFKNSISYGNIKTTDFTVHRGQVSVLTGGFPCQPYSTAGKRLGKSDERHLFPEMLRAIKEIQPTWIIGENVRGLVGWNEGLVFHEVYDDLEREGYEVQSFLIPAASVNAPHQRYRVWFVAYSSSNGGQKNTKQQSREDKKDNEQFECLYDSIIAADSTSEGTRQFSSAYSGGENRRFDNHGEAWNAADSKLHTHPYPNNRSSNEEERDVRRKETSNVSDASNSLGDATDPNAARILQQHTTTEPNQSQQFSRAFPTRGDFSAFPTKSPICGGNDGISRELDGITFSKWRNESIKAYGNAIVPQLAYQLFQTIQIIENAHEHHQKKNPQMAYW
jgi:DNA (cytosine-5)-methyltransferase 1